MISYHLRKYPFSIIVALTIIVISLIPVPEIKMVEDVPLADKWTHMVMYGGLSFTVWTEYLHKHRATFFKKLLLWGFIMPIILGGVMELAQAYLTTCRSGDWWDFIANSIGVIVNLILGQTTLTLAPKLKKAKKGPL